MKIVDVHVDGFGVWSDLMLADLSPDCTVFYVPNMATGMNHAKLEVKIGD